MQFSQNGYAFCVEVIADDRKGMLHFNKRAYNSAKKNKLFKNNRLIPLQHHPVFR